MRAIPRIYRNCPAAPWESVVQFNPAVFAEAMELVKFALRYEQVMYCFELAVEVRYNPVDQRTIFTFFPKMRAPKVSCDLTPGSFFSLIPYWRIVETKRIRSDPSRKTVG